MKQIVKDSPEHKALLTEEQTCLTNISLTLSDIKGAGLNQINLDRINELHKQQQSIKDQLRNVVEPAVPHLEEFVCIIANIKKAETIISIRSDGYRVYVLIKRERGASEEWKEGNVYLYDCFYKAKQLMDAKISFNFVRFYTVGCVDWVNYKSMYNILKAYPKASEAVLNGQSKVTIK